MLAKGDTATAHYEGHVRAFARVFAQLEGSGQLAIKTGTKGKIVYQARVVGEGRMSRQLWHQEETGLAVQGDRLGSAG